MAARVLKRKDNADAPVTGQVNRLGTSENQEPIPALTRHQVQLRDGGRCTQLDARGNRCENRRWIDIHHIRARRLAGANTLENLVTLCSAHHRMEHGQKG